MFSFMPKPSQEVLRLAKLLEDNKEKVTIDSSSGKVSLNLSKAETRADIVRAAREFFRIVSKVD